MLPIKSLVDGTIEDAVEALSKAAAHRRVVPLSYAEKRAIAMSDVLSGIGTHVKNNPVAAQALVGGGLGAAAGGLGTVWSNRDKEEHEKTSPWSSMLTGGLAGAALGGGVGLARKSFDGMRDGSATVGPTEFTSGGRKMELDPSALDKHPDLLNTVNNLEQPTAEEYIGKGMQTGVSALAANTPYKTWAAMLAGDIALNNQSLRLGERNVLGHVAGAGRTAKNWLTNWYDTKAPSRVPYKPVEGLNLGHTRPEYSTDPDHLVRGLQEAGDKSSAPEVARNALKADKTNLDLLGRDPLQPNTTLNEYAVKRPGTPAKVKNFDVDHNGKQIQIHCHSTQTI